MPRLRRTSPDDPGWTRRRAGRGFVYLDENGERLSAPDAQRVKDLVIPPGLRLEAARGEQALRDGRNARASRPPSR